MSAIGDFAEQQFADAVRGQWNNWTQRRSLCMDALARHFGAATFPLPTTDNARETDKGMILKVGS